MSLAMLTGCLRQAYGFELALSLGVSSPTAAAWPRVGLARSPRAGSLRRTFHTNDGDASAAVRKFALGRLWRWGFACGEDVECGLPGRAVCRCSRCRCLTRKVLKRPGRGERCPPGLAAKRQFELTATFQTDLKPIAGVLTPLHRHLRTRAAFGNTATCGR